MGESFKFDTTVERSKLMSKIRSCDTGPERKLRRELWKKGFRYRINSTALPGKPDIVITKYKIAIFVDGGFWHGHNWEIKRDKIKSNKDYWVKKIERNMVRDSEVNQKLNNLGYTVLRFWDFQIIKDLDFCLLEIANQTL